jgi:ComEC/Rec2-related protein
MLYPHASRDLLLVLAFGVLWAVVPRAQPLDRPLSYIGLFTVVDARSLRDSLGQLWHTAAAEGPGSYFGALTLRPFESLDLPFVFRAKEVYGAKGMLGEARILKAELRHATETPNVLKGWTMRVEKLPWSEGAKALVQAMVLGKARDLPEGIRTGMQRLGLSHLTAVSGFHLGLLWGLIAACSRMLPWGIRPLVRMAGVGGIWAYVSVIGMPISAVRAAVMLTVLALLGLGSRRKSSLRGLAFTVGGMLLYQPEWLYDLGFQLSVSAVLGIVLWMRWPFKSGWKTLGISLVAQFSTLWVALPTFHLWPWFFWPANVLLTPLLLLVYPYAGFALVAQALGHDLPFPEKALDLLASVPDSWVWEGGYLGFSGRLALAVAVVGGWWGLYTRRKGLCALALCTAWAVMVESTPLPTQERTWHRHGRGLAQVEVRGDSALVQGTQGFLGRAYYWDKSLQGYWRSRGVKHIEMRVVSYSALPETLRTWGESRQEALCWVRPRSIQRTSW